MAQDVIVEIGAKIDQLISAVDQVKAKIGEVGPAAESTKGAFEGLGEIIKETFSIAAIIEFSHRMMELGVQTRNMALVLGVSTETVGGLKFAAEAAGTSIETLSAAGERLTLNIQRASRDALGPMSSALHNLGLNAKEFQNLNLTQTIARLAQATEGLDNSTGNVTKNLQVLFGRNQALIALILRGTEAFKENVEEGTKLASITEAQTATLEKLHHEWLLFRGELLGPSMSAMEAIKNIFESTRHEIELITEALDKLGRKFFQTSQERINEGFSQIPQGPSSEFAGKKQIPPPAFDARQQAEINKLRIDAELGEEKAALEQKKILYAQDAAQYKITEEQRVRATGTVEVAILQAEVDAIAKKQLIYQKGTLDWEKLETERKIATAKVSTEIVNAQKNTTTVIAAEWASVGNTISSALTGSLRGLLEGTITWGDAFKKILEDLIIKIIEAIVQMEILAALEAATGTLGASAPSTILKSIIPHFAEGTPMVPQTQLAMVHKGEMVIPSGMADMIRSGQSSIGGSGSNVNLSISAWDGASVAQWLRGGGGKMLSKSIAEHWNQNSGMRPAY